jgi:hypothetical protein
MQIRGACHCGNLAFELDWPEPATRIPARACGCTFCRKHGASWTSNPEARLRVIVQDPAQVERYNFGTRTADFHVCKRCGVPAVVTSRIDGHDYAVVNINTFEGVDPAMFDRSTSDFDGEATEDRLARRKSRWIASVTGV